MLVDDCLPVFDISDAVATVVQADVEATWVALMEVDLIDVGYPDVDARHEQRCLREGTRCE